MASAIILTVNKWVMTDTKIPVFYLSLQLLISVILLVASKHAGIIKVGHFQLGTAKKLWKLVFMNCFSIIFGNFTLRYVDASIYQVVRGLILPITCLFSFFLEAKPPTLLVLGSCAIVTSGFLIGVGWNSWVHLFGGMAEGAVKPSGIFFGLLSSAATAYHSIVIKESLAHVGGSAVDLAYYGNICSVLVMLPAALLNGEGPAILKLTKGEEPLGRLFWGVFLTGLCGFCISVAGVLQIKITSPISHMVSSAMRGVLTTIISAYLFGDIITSSRVFSIFIIIFGSCHYMWAKSQEYKNKPQATQTTDEKLVDVEAGTEAEKVPLNEKA